MAWINFPTRVTQTIRIIRKLNTNPIPSRVKLPLCSSISAIVIGSPPGKPIFAYERTAKIR
jgi:hypothetical protein